MKPKPKSDLSSLEERVQKLAADKSNLQLIVRMMNRINAVAGLDNVVECLLQTISDVIGGVNLGLYYFIDQHLHYADAFGTKKSLEAADDELVRQVFQTRQTVEIELPFSATEMMTPEFTKGYTWVVPLVVGPDLVGVLRLERLHLAMKDLSEQLPTFFNYAALVLKNEISGHSRLQQAYAQLELEMTERLHAEEALRQSNETLEERVTERTSELQRSNAQVHRLNRELRAISNCNQVLMRAVDETTLLNDICHIICDEAGYRMAWVGYAEHDAARTVRTVGHAGVDDSYLATARISWADTAHGRGPTGTAIRSGTSQGVDDFATAPHVAPWREPALQRGYRSSLALPLKDDGGRTFGALSIYSSEPNAFPPEEVRLMEELAGDLAFGISVLRERLERKRAEEQLRRSEHGLAEAQRLAQLGNWSLDLTSNLLTWSAEIYRIFEIDPEKSGVSYADFLDAIHPEDRAKVNQIYTDSIKNRTPYDIVHRLLMPDGRIKHVREKGGTYHDTAGKPLRSAGTVQDITELMQAEQALRRSEEKYRSLIQKLQTAVVVHAADTRILTCNPIAQSLLGLTEDQLLGKTAIDPDWHFFREDGTPMPPEEYPVAQALATRQPVRNLVLGVHRPGSGSDVWAMVNANPVIDPDGQLTEIIVTFIDITERKQAQERLAHLAAIVESTDDAIIGKSLDERILSWNHGAERIYGYTAAEIVGRTISTLVPPELQEELNRIMVKLKRGERVEHLETMRRRRDGQLIQVALTISPIRGARGEIVGASTIARDITERKQAEETLRKFAIEVQDLYDQAPCGYHSLAEDGTLLRINDTELSWLGYKREEIVGKVKFSELLTPQSQTVFQREFPAYKERGWVRDLDFELVRKDGTTFPVLLSATAIKDARGRYVTSRSVLHDITERKQIEEQVRRLNTELEQRVADRTRELAGSEERMRLFFERQLMGTAITSPEKGWLQVNDKLCQMLGYAREELLRLTWAELTYPEDLTADVTEFDRLLRGEIEGYMIEKRFVRKDGTLVYTNLAVGCVRRPDRSVDYLLALMEDITERKRAEANIQQLNKELRQRADSLEAANKGLESFSYSVSHDLRAPLRSIDGFSRILLDDCADRLTAEEKDALRRIRAASQRMGQIIDDLLNLARVSRDAMHRGPVDLSALAGTVAARLRQATPEQVLEFVIAPGLVAEGDARLLQIVLENLLGNAGKFSSRQPVARIEFGLTTNKGQPAYFVRDNGAGFDRAAAHKLFGAFQRFHSAEEFPGTGIGLATVQRIIHRHGGHVWAESEPGHGATFFFTLPEQPMEP